MQLRFIFLFLLFHIFAYSVSYAADTRYLKADNYEYFHKEGLFEARGNVILNYRGYNVRADRVLIDTKNNQVSAKGNIMVSTKEGAMIRGEYISFKEDMKEALIRDFRLRYKTKMQFIAKSAYKNNNNYKISSGKFTTCSCNLNSLPAWQISSKNITIDSEVDRVIYSNCFFEIKGIPVMYLPYLSYPLNMNKSSSGILMPKIDFNGLAIPFYISLKPNLDITVTPKYSPHHVILEKEVRYLTHNGFLKLSSSMLSGFTKDELNNSQSFRGYVFLKGNYKIGESKLGIDLRHISDRNYMMRHYDKDKSYFKSSVQLSNAKDNHYFDINLINFKDLSTNSQINIKKGRMYVLPEIETAGTLFFDDDVSLDYGLDNSNILSDKGERNHNISGEAVITKTKNHNGSIFKMSFASRIVSDIKSGFASNSQNKIIYLPELLMSLYTPLIHNNKSNYSTIIGPKISMVLAKNNNIEFEKTDKYYLFNSNNFEQNNKYYDMGNIENGSKLRVGVDSYSSSIIYDLNFNCFSGFEFNQNSKYNKYVLDVSFNYGDIFEVSYLSNRKLKNFFNTIDEDLRIEYLLHKNIKVGTSYKLIKFKKLGDVSNNNKKTIQKIRQQTFDIELALSEYLKARFESKIDFSEYRKPNYLAQSFQLGYKGNCYKFSASLKRKKYSLKDKNNIEWHNRWGMSLDLTLNI